MERAEILVVEDDPNYVELYGAVLKAAGYTTAVASDPQAALAAIHRRAPDLVLLDLTFEGTPQAGLDFIPDALHRQPDLPITVVSSQDQSAIITKALELGAVDYIVKDQSLYDLLAFRVGQTLTRTRLERRIKMDGGFIFDAGRVIIGRSPAMVHVYDLIERVAQHRSTVLILGESGTGKELVAQAIHARKGLPSAPFVSIDCGAVPKSVLEPELFGVKANYPGFHNKERLVGKLEAAGEGTLFLDEIGNMEMDLQASLLRVLEERRFTPIGDTTPQSLKAQVVASTNVNIDAAIRTGKFREDLYYRLNEVPIVLPPLRDRKEDIPLLVRHVLAQHEVRSGDRIEIVPEAVEKLMAYDWPGNVRELVKTLQRAATLCRSRYLTPKDFDLSPSTAKPTAGAIEFTPVDESVLSISVRVPFESTPLAEFTRAARRAYAKHAMAQSKGNRLMAAGLLGVDIRTLRRLLNNRSGDEGT
ncbi:MAG: sigma-54-dependent transcriptional regulator [Nitrospirota bacterium]